MGEEKSTAVTPALLQHWVTFFKAHEKLLAIILGLGVLWHLYGTGINAWIDHDKRVVQADQLKQAAAAQQSQADQQANQQLLQQLADLKTQYASLSAQLQAQRLQRQQQTNAQKQQNNQATTSEVASRTTELLRLPAGEITATDQSETLSAVAAHTNVNALEDLQQSEADNKDLTVQLATSDAVAKKDDDAVVGLQKQIADDKITCATSIQKEKDNTKLAVDEGKKQFRRGLKYGYIAGIATAVIIKIARVF